ncbi:glycosyl hydrolase [Opitutaceae bacterium TAV4]|nr:glycosyl hydrolase [Opitutaceae bacterium TAV4]RRK00438.1 glycosyl hydrolase [Opitutaceae bacterium TAV3]
MKDILVVPHNHFDLTWRRAFDRPATKHGVTIRSYYEIEELCINRWLSLAKKGYPFSDGQTATWRRYLERNPVRLPELRAHARRGLLDLLFAGETVQDSNLPSAEGLVRNFLVAQDTYRKILGDEAVANGEHLALKMAWMEDAFGNSANYPQILKGVGAEVAAATTYNKCPDPVWVGIDGTALPCLDQYPKFRPAFVEKHRPCPECRGTQKTEKTKTCPACNGTGMALIDTFDHAQIETFIDEAIADKGSWAVLYILTEENLPDATLQRFISNWNRKHSTRRHARLRLANVADIYRRYLPELTETIAGSSEKAWKKPTIELAPASPGGAVTRIRTKQRTRAIAYKLIQAESALATVAWQTGSRPDFSTLTTLRDAWRKVCFNQFHDAITGTHIDTAYDELMELLDEAEAVVDDIIPQSSPGGEASPRSPRERSTSLQKSIRPTTLNGGLGETSLPGTKSLPPPSSHRLGDFTLTCDLHGILDIRHAASPKTDLFGTIPGFTRADRPLRIGELLFEADFGDAWSQRIAPFASIERDVTRVPLGNFHTHVEILSDSVPAIRWHGRYTGGDPKVKTLEWTVTVALSDDGRRLDFTTEVDWDTASRRLRVLFPVNSRADTAYYEIPYGFIERRYDPQKLNYSQWRAHTMEFPALHWVHRPIDSTSGVALLNKGLPCWRWLPGRFDLSLLRSPEWSFCAVEAGNYEFWDIDGQRDTGRHRFEYSLIPYATCAPASAPTPHDLTLAGYAYNNAAPPPVALPFTLDPAATAIVTAWKLAENASDEVTDTWVIRLQETSGRSTRATLTFTEPVSLTPANLLEDPVGSASRAGHRHTVRLHRHGLATLRIRRIGEGGAN